MTGATSTRIPGDPNAPEATLRDQLATLTLEANSLAQGLARVSHAWDQTEQAAAERRELERLRVHPPTPVRSRELALPAPDADPVVPGGVHRRRFRRPAWLRWGSAPVRWLGIGGICLAISAGVTGVFVGSWTLIGWAVTR